MQWILQYTFFLREWKLNVSTFLFTFKNTVFTPINNFLQYIQYNVIISALQQKSGLYNEDFFATKLLFFNTESRAPILVKLYTNFLKDVSIGF
jgi:hypothetical protein